MATHNPPGSSDPRDLVVNAGNLDVLVTSKEKLSQNDRLGVPRKTWHAMEVEHNAAQTERAGEFTAAQSARWSAFDADQTDRLERFDQMEVEFDSDQSQRSGLFAAAQSSRSIQFDEFLDSSGYHDLGDYAPGILITAHNQYVTHDGQPYTLKPSVAVPYTTAGAWTGTDFKLIGDAVLRQELATGSAQIGEVSAKQASISAQETRVPSVLRAVREMPTTDPTPINTLDGETWGRKSGRLYSTLDGITWVDRMASSPGIVLRLIATSDGEVVIVNGAGAYKSSGWPGSGTTWVQKLANSGGTANIVDWGLSGDGVRFIVGEYASGAPSAGWENSQKAWISTDSGETFTVKYDAAVRYPDSFASTHLHGVCFDQRSGLFFISEGHSAAGGIYYSADDGDTWTAISPDKYMGAIAGGLSPNPTTLTANRNGIVCGSDSHNQGVMLIERADRPEDMRVRWTYDLNYGEQGVQLFCNTAQKDDLTDIVYIGMFTNHPLGTSYYTIIASDGIGGNLVWRGDLVTESSSRVDSVSILPNRKLIWRTSGQESKQYIADLGSAGSLSLAETDTGGVLGGIRNDVPERGLSVAVGRASRAGRQSTSVGVKSVSGESAVAVGVNAAAATTSVAVGASAITTGTVNTVAVGRSASVTVSDGVAVGSGAISQGGVSVGRNANARNLSVSIGGAALGKTGTSGGIAIGNSSQHGNNGVSVGMGSNTGNDAVAIGKDAAASPGSGNSVAVGQAASTGGIGCIAIGRASSAPATDATAVGASAVAQSNSVALGRSASALSDSVAIGSGTSTGSPGDVVMGHNATSGASFGNSQTVIGRNAQSMATGGSAIGAGATVSSGHNESVALGRNSVTQRGNSVCVGSRDIESTKAGGRLYLRSPNGSVFYISVSDAGVISVTAG